MSFKVILILGVILCVSQNVLSLEEDDFELMEEIQEYLGDIIIQYDKMLDSAREEMRMMINNYNALSVSRMGFVAIEMMDIQNTVQSSIQQRAIEINSTRAQCIVDATTELEYIVSNAGPGFAQVSKQMSIELVYLADFLFFPLVDHLHELMSSFEKDLYILFIIYNPVTEFDGLLRLFLRNLIVLNRVFENFVDDVHLEMIDWSMIMDDVSADNFPILQSSLDYFRFNANLIENTLADCNADEI